MSFKLELHKELTQITTYQDKALGIMRWGKNNSFPQTLKNVIAQSPSAKPAVDRTAKFYRGDGFKGDDEVVNPYGLTLSDVVDIMADDLATFESFAIHCNYNLDGQVVSMNPLRITDLRFNEFDEFNFSSKLGYHPDYGHNSVVKKSIVNTVTSDKIKWIDRFNPHEVLNQIKRLGEEYFKKSKKKRSDIEILTKGISIYNGQVDYYSKAGFSSYPIPPLQSAINFVLSDVENSILVRKETATGFISSYILKTTKSADDANLTAFENALVEAQGARGTGKIVTMSELSQEEVNSTMLEEIAGGAGGRKNIIDSAKTCYELDQKVINATYLIPPILAGADQKTGFSSADLKEAYWIFNSITQDGRNLIASHLNRIFRKIQFSKQEILK